METKEIFNLIADINTVDFKVIPHSEQRYDTVGDWLWCTLPDKPCPFDLERGDYGAHVLHIRVSKMSDPRYELLVFHHELTEALLCREAGLTAEIVDAWDEEYERRRPELLADEIARATAEAKILVKPSELPCGCDITATSEPGDDLHCPYFLQHQVATNCEIIFASALKVEWEPYIKEIEKKIRGRL